MKTKIKVKDKVYELTDCCRWEVRDGVLWNLNTDHDEGVDGDIIKYGGKTGTVEGYTCYQLSLQKNTGKKFCLPMTIVATSVLFTTPQ